MRVLDRYLVRELIIPVFISSATLIFLVLIADLFDNLDAFLKNRTPFLFAVRYYLMLTPFVFIQTIPWATFLATVYLLVSFNFHNEIIAMKAAGLEVLMIVRPLLFVGFLIGIFSFLVSDQLVPETYRRASEIRDVHIEKKREKEEKRVFQNVTYYSGGNQLHYYRFYNDAQKQVEDAILLWLDPVTRSTTRKMVAKKGTWREEKGWEFEFVTEYEMDPQGRILGEPRNFAAKTYPDVRVTPKDLRYASGESLFLSTRELKDYIHKLEKNGIKASNERVEQQYRIAFPWNPLVVMMIAIPLLSPTQSKKMIAFNVLISLGVVFLFHISGAVALALGKAGRLPPFLSAWLSTIIFLGGAVYFLERANE